MSIALHSITFDCHDALSQATFWAAATGHQIAAGATVEFASLAPGGSSTPETWMFIQVPEGKSTKNRMHLDLRSDDRTGEVTRLVALGASLVAEHTEGGTTWNVLTDPEGNEFCVV